MYESQLALAEPETEADLYEDLSQLIKTFKRILALSSDIMDLFDQDSPLPSIQQLREIPENNRLLAEHYNTPLDENSPNKNTINRFICRLYEALCLYKGGTFQRNQASVLYREFLEKTEQAITSYCIDRNVGKMFKKILHFTERFCSSCEIILNQGFKEELLTYFSSHELGEKEEPLPRTRQPGRRENPSRSQSNFHKAMNVLNRRFSTLNCLDLDYNSFKTCFFQSKTQKKELYQECMQRNAITWKYIHSYSKLFSDYLKKKEKYINRKNRFKEKLEGIVRNQAETKHKNEIKNSSKNEGAILKEGKEHQLPALIKNQQKEDSPEKKSEISGCFKDCDPRKTQYNLKNVYLTLNKAIPSTNSAVYDRDLRNVQKKSGKEINPAYSNFKVAKVSTKGKTFEQEKSRHKPLLQIKQIESRQYGYTFDHSLAPEFNSNAALFEQARQFKGKKIHCSKKSISEKKSIRLSHILGNNKSAVNTKSTPSEEDQLLYEIRVLNCEQEDLPRK